MTDEPFDIHEHRRIRNRELEQRCAFLEGERDRLEELLALTLWLAGNTINQPPLLILEAVITKHGTNPGLAHIHQPSDDHSTGRDALAA